MKFHKVTQNNVPRRAIAKIIIFIVKKYFLSFYENLYWEMAMKVEIFQNQGFNLDIYVLKIFSYIWCIGTVKSIRHSRKPLVSQMD